MDLTVLGSWGHLLGNTDEIPIEHAHIYRPHVYEGDPYENIENPFRMPPDLEPGFYNMAFEKYLKYPLPDYSFYKEFSRSPSHGLAYLAEQKKPVSKQKQKNFDFGSALHWLVLEPDKFERNVIVDPGFNKNRNDYKHWRSRLPAGAIVLEASEVDQAMRIRERLYKKPTIRRLLEESGRCELTAIFQDPEFGLYHKVRIDKLLTGYPVVVDFKTAASASEFGFSRAIINYKYDWQAALYLTALRLLTGYRYEKWVWIVAEKEPPYECRAKIADLSDINDAIDKVYGCIDRLSACIDTSYWPGYPDIGEDYVFGEAEDLEPDYLPF